MKSLPDYVQRRIVVEIGRQYVYVYMTTGDGKLLPEFEESFKQPYRLDPADANTEAKELWDLIYDHANDTINWPTASDDGDGDTVE